MADEIIVGAIVAIAVAVINALLAIFQRADRKEAEAEGDTIVSALEMSVSAVQVFIPLVPEPTKAKAQAAIDAYAKMVADIKAGWNDKVVTNVQLLDAKMQRMLLLAEIKGILGK